MSKPVYDFEGWASKNDLKCSDGRIIRAGAFRVNDGKRVPLVWNHQHNSVDDVLGHAVLENRNEGVYAYCSLNDTPGGQHAKESIRHGDVTNLSIWANNLQQRDNEVLHGVIREVSLVLAGANPGAFIESVLTHGVPMDDYEEEGIFYNDEDIFLSHAIDEDDKKEEPKEEPKGEKKEDNKVADNGGDKTVQDVIDSMTEEQKNVMYGLIGSVLQEMESDDEGDEEMKHNIFSDDYNDQTGGYLSHSDEQAIINDAKRIGSLREAFNQNYEDGVLVHADWTDGMVTPTKPTETYGFKSPDMFYPDSRTLTNVPEFIGRRTEWVSEVINKVHHTPFSRVKSMYANITEDEARARGYIKGKQKKTEVFSTLKRITNPTTIYKLQKMDRDDILDITDFDVVSWIRQEMRVMLDEELARAILIGDGRAGGTDDKILEDCIRPIAKDVDLFNVKVKLNFKEAATGADKAKAVIDGIIRAHKQYRGSGNPTLFTTDDWLTEMLLLEDQIGHKLYKTQQELATALRVSNIVTVEVMENQKIGTDDLIGVIVNLADYNVGQDPKAGINMFDDFDIDFNRYTYLIETRMSGCLVKPFSAVTITAQPSGE